MRLRIAGLIVLVAVLAAGYYFGRPFLQGYLGARQQTVPNAPVQMVSPAPVPVDKAPAKGTGQQSIQQIEKQYPVLTKSQGNNSPPQTGVPATGNAAGGESQIDISYLGQLNKIGQYYQGQLNTLVAQAYDSYQAVKEGKSNTPLLSLAGQYVGQGQTLQKQSDAQFYSVLDQYQAALQKAGLPTAYEEQARTDYETAKAAEKQKILSAAEQYLK